jgi:hypothetical protein
MKIVGIYFYKKYHKTYPICYEKIIIDGNDIMLTTCDDDNLTIKNFDPDLAYFGYTIKDNNIVPVAPMKFSEFNTLLGIGGILFGAILLFSLINIFINFKK